MMQENNKYSFLHQSGAVYLREYAYKHGNEIYNFMDHYDVGKSLYGTLMDSKGKAEAVHRLYGHHIVYDFPINNPEEKPFFLAHEFSDLFTKQGLPIIPGELLKDAGLLKYCRSLSHNWNFVNGFDLLSGTMAIYNSINSLQSAFDQEFSINSIEDMAKHFGIGALEFMLAISSANPFLLLGASLQICAALKGVLTDSSVVYFRKVNKTLKIEFTLDKLKIDQTLNVLKQDYTLQTIKLKNTIDRIKK